MGRFPNGKKFAFSIFDDTDNSTVQNVGPIYQLLTELGIRATKSVWSLPNVNCGRFMGSSTLQDPEYLDWVLTLREQGFEIAYHGARNDSSTRDVIEKGLHEYCRLLGEYPKTYANHSLNRENIYWGEARLTRRSVPYFVYKTARATHQTKGQLFEGHAPDSPYFWGDLCKRYIKYVRNLSFDEINIERVNPSLPYNDPNKPYVNYWFSSADGGNCERFCNVVSEANQDRLEEEGGVCIIFSHFAKDFVKNGAVVPRLESLLSRFAAKDSGWFAPAGEVLDYLLSRRPDTGIPAQELARMERNWVMQKISKRGV